MTVNSYDPRPTAPRFRIFFQLKRASRQPFQIPCVFSSKTRLALNVIVNLYDSLPHSLFFSKKTRVAGILPHSSGSLSLCFLRYNVSWVHKSVSVNSRVMLPAPAGSRFFSQGKTRLGGMTRKFKVYVDQGVFSCVCRKGKK